MEDDRPYAGIKVLAVTRVLGSPFAAYQLALHGAEVIQIEDPGVGDNARKIGGSHTKKLADAGLSVGFLAHGANKKSLTLNLKKPEAQKIFLQLAKDADVIIENLRVGTMNRYGLGYKDVNKINPRIVYSSLTGFGQTGPRRFAAGLDSAIQAGSGMMSITGTPESGPLKVGTSVIDYAAGFALALGIAMALHKRERTGKGQYVDVSLMETALVLMSRMVSDVQNAGYVPVRIGNRGENDSHVMNAIKCKDTHLFVATAQTGPRNKFFQTIGRADLIEDPRFKNIDLIRKNADALYAELEKTLTTKPAAEWEAMLAPVGVPAMRVNSLPEAIDDPQIKERKFYHTFDKVPGLDSKVTVPLASYRLSDGGARIDSPPPLLSQHTDEILKGLGYGAEEIARLRTEGAI